VYHTGDTVRGLLTALYGIGGLGSLPGAVLGAVYVYGVQYLLPAGWSVFATGAGIVVLLMFLPGGLGELVFRVRDGILRRIAARHGLVVPSLVADTAAPPEEPPGLSVGEAPLLGAGAAVSAAAGEAVPVLAAPREGAGDARG